MLLLVSDCHLFYYFFNENPFDEKERPKTLCPRPFLFIQIFCYQNEYPHQFLLVANQLVPDTSNIQSKRLIHH